jgi:hypothetical protein
MRTYKYLRYMRDGSTKEMTGVVRESRVRKGKTAKDNRKRV